MDDATCLRAVLAYVTEIWSERYSRLTLGNREPDRNPLDRIGQGELVNPLPGEKRALAILLFDDDETIVRFRAPAADAPVKGCHFQTEALTARAQVNPSARSAGPPAPARNISATCSSAIGSPSLAPIK